MSDTNATSTTIEPAPKREQGGSKRVRRVRSAVTARRRLFAEGGSGSSRWCRRFSDLLNAHIGDIAGAGGIEALTAAQVGMIRQASAIECETEAMQAALSAGEPCDLELFQRLCNTGRRLWQALGYKHAPRASMTLGEAWARAERDRMGVTS